MRFNVSLKQDHKAPTIIHSAHQPKKVAMTNLL